MSVAGFGAKAVKVVHCKRSPYTVYIGRPSVFGNPHPIGYCSACCCTHDRATAIAAFAEDVREMPNTVRAIEQLPEDAVLGCWCSPKPCHGDTIIELWNELHKLSKS